MSEMHKPTRREQKAQREREELDQEIARMIADRVLKKVVSVGQEIPVTGRFNRGSTTKRSIEIAQENLVERGVHITVVQREDAANKSYDAVHTSGKDSDGKEISDKALPHDVFVVDELDDTKRQSRRRDKR